jgi:large-conductance mechanosensitive channel
VLFLIIRAMSRLIRKEEDKRPAEPPKQEQLLAEIRDLLKSRQ